MLCAYLVLLWLCVPVLAAAQVAEAEPEYTGSDRIEEWRGKTILVVTPHPDDETFFFAPTLLALRDLLTLHVLCLSVAWMFCP